MLTVLLLCAFISNLAALTPDVHWKIPNKQASVEFVMPVASEDALYKDFITFSTDNDKVTITQWSAHADPTTVYDPIFKENKRIYVNDVPFTLDISLKEPVTDANIRFTYYLKSKGSIEEQLLHIPLVEISTKQAPVTAETTAQEPSTPQEAAPVADSYDPSASWSCTISNLIKHTHSLWLQCLLILLLGALLSLTPCIYPMIPITVGILQGQGSTSFIRNFFISICYTIGVATTFSLLGLTAAYTGKLFGTFMQHPLIIMLIVLLLLYLAGSMFGLYEMYVPRIFSGQSSFTKGGSAPAAFLFGMLSGTVASPCVSPGLALVLSIVAGLANPFLGFLFLFVFGIGLSLPLLIIGTFSGSLQLLPRAGMWMIEIKKLFGFLLLGMCIYFLKVIIPLFVAAWLQVALLVVAGIYYLYARNKQASSTGRILYQLLGIILIALSVIMSYQAVRATIMQQECATDGIWLYDYACAQAKAIKEDKLLFIKVEAPCCSMCTAIDKKFFHHNKVTAIMQKQYVPVIIDGSETTEQTQTFVHTFNIIGFPTILIIDPQTQEIIKQWSSDLYNYTIDELVSELVYITLTVLS